MKKRQRIKTKVGLVFLTVAALTLGMVPALAMAQDSDSDGFTDLQEIEGIVLHNGDVVPGLDSQLPREQRLDPTTPDLFVILVSAEDLDPTVSSNLPANPLEFINKPQAEGGLGIVTHEIPYAVADPKRYVTPTQKAVRITEKLDPEGIILGYANQGTPNGLDEAIIYTERIKNHIYSTCADAGTCIDSAGNTGQNLIDTYIKHTIAHEIGHMTRLAVDYNRRFGGYHYKSGSKVIMEQAVVYTDKKGKVTFYISTEYAEPSQEGLLLK